MSKDIRKVERISNFVRCPFCDYPVETSNPGAWCAGCLVEYRLTQDWVVFDKNRNEFGFARAFAAAGGVRIGSDETLKGVKDG